MTITIILPRDSLPPPVTIYSDPSCPSFLRVHGLPFLTTPALHTLSALGSTTAPPPPNLLLLDRVSADCQPTISVYSHFSNQFPWPQAPASGCSPQVALRQSRWSGHVPSHSLALKASCATPSWHFTTLCPFTEITSLHLLACEIPQAPAEEATLTRHSSISCQARISISSRFHHNTVRNMWLALSNSLSRKLPL